MKIEYRAPKNDTEMHDTLECIARAFGGGEWALPFFTNIAVEDPWFNRENIRACFVNGKAVSAVEVFDRPVQYGSTTLRLAGIGSVGTDPDHRRAGYSINVLKDTVNHMLQERYDFSLLWTGVPTHYRRMGWYQYPEFHLELTLPDNISDSTTDATIETANLERDLAELHTLYTLENTNRTGTLIRTEHYWAQQPKWRAYDTDRFYIAKQDGKIVAYLKTGQREIQEFACLPDSEAALKDLVIHFFNRAKIEEQQNIHTQTPAQHYSLFADLGCPLRRREGRGGMLRIVDLESFLSKIIPELENRLQQSDHPTTTLRLNSEIGSHTLHIQNSRITFTDQKHDIDLHLGHPQLLGLLFGSIYPDHIAFTNQLDLTEEQIALLTTLFPPGEFFYWGTDRV